MDNLDQYDLSNDPFKSFLSWHRKASQSESNANAATLSTASKEGKVSARIILYKGLENQRFPVYTNLKSRKAIELEQNPNASLVFWWPSLGRQIRMTTQVHKMESQRAKAYFQSREKLSQVASYISNQSQKIESRQKLEEKFEKGKKEFENCEVPFPEKRWGGFWLSPTQFEFFIYRDFRLNDRFQFNKSSTSSNEDFEKWIPTRLQP